MLSKEGKIRWEWTFAGLFLCGKPVWIISLLILSEKHIYYSCFDRSGKNVWEVKSHSTEVRLTRAGFEFLAWPHGNSGLTLRTGSPAFPHQFTSFSLPAASILVSFCSWTSQISSSSRLSSSALFLSGIFFLWLWSVFFLSFQLYWNFSSTRVQCDLLWELSPDHLHRVSGYLTQLIFFVWVEHWHLMCIHPLECSGLQEGRILVVLSFSGWAHLSNEYVYFNIYLKNKCMHACMNTRMATYCHSSDIS